MKCLNCGNELTENTQFCPKCGAKNEQRQSAVNEVICPHCGKRLAANMLYCSGCGNSIYGGKKKNNAGIIALAVVSVIVTLSCLIFLLIFFFGPKNEKTEIDNEHIVERLDDEDVDDDDYDEEDDDDNDDNDVWAPVDKHELDDDEYYDEDEYYDDYSISDIRGMNRSEAAFARNEIYARHGYIFKTEPYKSYFEAQSWYSPNVNFSENLLSDYEKKMVNALISYEKSMGWR